MLKIEKFTTPSPEQWEMVIEGARNAMNSWDQMDSEFLYTDPYCGEPPYDYQIGPNDHDLLMRLAKAGTDESKYRRMLPVHVTLTAPLYWWKEFDTYRVGVAPNPTDIEMNSCSTMHKIHAKEFTLDDFSTEHLFDTDSLGVEVWSLDTYRQILETLNVAREAYLSTKDKRYWWQMIQLLPTSYNQKRTLSLNYEALANMHRARRHHKLDEWHVVCDWIETLPYSELILAKKEKKE